MNGAAQARGLIRWSALTAFALGGWVSLDFWRVSAGTGRIAERVSSIWAGMLLAAALFTALAGVALIASILRPAALRARITALEEGILRWPPVMAWLTALTPAVLATGLLLSRRFDTLQLFPLRVLLLFLFSLAAALALRVRGWGLAPRWALTAMAIAGAYLVLHRLTLVTDYPFALGWSEGNRLWDYSLYFGRGGYTISGEFRFPTYLTPGRHGLWGLPFLIPGVSIQAVRLWDAILWTTPYLLLGLAMVGERRTRLDRAGRWTFGLWSLLFLSQGPIYAPLVLGVLVIAFGFDARKPGRAMGFAALASFYAGISRWTWFAAPAMLAGLWSLLNGPSEERFLRRLRWPVAIGLAGLTGGAVSQVAMALAFPQPEPAFATTARQALLWYRLLPSVTNPIGIIPALVLVATPVVALMAVWIRRHELRWDGLQLLGAVAVLGPFLAVGLAASVKIGGGNNLHNLDMFLVGLVVLAGIAVAGLGPDGVGAFRRASVLTALAVLVPSALAVKASAPLALPDPQVVRDSLAVVQSVASASARSGEVLFIDQRQLFTFSHLPGVPLVVDYELKDLMNQAMGNNRSYLDRFERDLAGHRFVLIVSDPTGTGRQGRFRAFGEENDAWVEHVAVPLLTYYQVDRCLEEVDVCFYTPKDS